MLVNVTPRDMAILSCQQRRAGSHPNSRCYRWGFRSRIRSKPAFIAAKRASTKGSNSLSVKIYGQSFSIPSRTSSPTYCGSTPFNRRSLTIWRGADERIAFRVCSLGRGKRAGRFRRKSIILVRTKPGQRTETPIPRGANSRRKPSERATTPYLLTLYDVEPREISPAIEAVDTMWPPSPCCSINGPKISMPQTTAIRLTPIVHSQPPSVQKP